MVTIVYAELATSGCYAALFLNGIPILSTGRHGGVFSSMPARQVLIRGTNRLELVVEPLEQPSRAREQRKMTLQDKWAVGRLVRYEEGVPAVVENGTVLLEQRWSADGVEATYPVVITGDVIVPDATHDWAWQAAPALQLGPELTAEAVAVLEEVVAAIRSGREENLMAALEPKLLDARIAYPVRDEALDRNELLHFMKFWHKAGDPLFPLEADQHDFRIVAGGRMLETVDLDGYASIRLRDPNDGEAIPYPLLLARLGGRLRVIR